MAELFTVIGEALALLAEIIAAWAHALLEGLIVLACFLFSRSFRSMRLEMWKLNPRKKFVDLGLASLWFVLVVGLPCFLILPSGKQSAKGEPVDPRIGKAGTNEDLRIELLTRKTNNPPSVGAVIVKKGGVSKILDTRSLGELKTQLVENASFVHALPTNTNPTTSK
jgi:hypothetical protein